MTSFLRSCQKETATPIKGKNKGNIPEWLEGTLVRNGGGMYTVGDTSFNHVFDGLSLMHNFTIEKGIVTYCSKFLQSDRYKADMSANRIILGEFGTTGYPDPCKTLWERFMSTFYRQPMSDNCNVNFTPYNDELYALTETNYIWKVDPKTMDTLEKVNISKHVAVNHATAHPHIDADGSVWNAGSSYNKGASYRIVKFPRPKPDEKDPAKTLSAFDQATIVTTIPARWPYYPGYYHSFSITENYVVFIEQPLVLSLSGFMTDIFRRKTFEDKVLWYPEYKVIFHVVNRITGETVEHRYESDVSFCFFHTINAYEEDSHLVLDLCAYKNGNMMKNFYLKHLEGMKISRQNGVPQSEIDARILAVPWRFVLPLKPREDAKVNENLITLKGTTCTAVKEKNGTITCSHEELFGNVYCELPAINYSLNGKKYRYFYVMSERALYKLDWQTKAKVKWEEEGTELTSPIFVASPNAVEEDQGVIIFVLLKTNSPKECSFVVLDAKTFKELGRSDFKANDDIPMVFHVMFRKKDDVLFSY